MNDILVVAQLDHGKIAKVSLELLGVATELNKKLNVSVCAVLMGYDICHKADELIAYGADKVFVYDGEQFAFYNTECFAEAVTNTIKREEPQIVLFGATSIGRDLAPRVSARLKTGLTADCTKLEIGDDGKLWMTRPAFGGNLFATIICPDHLPQMSTVRPGVMLMNQPDYTKKGVIVKEDSFAIRPTFNIELLEQKDLEKDEQSIEDVKILFSIGRGADNKDTINSAKEAALLTGGAVSASRAVVDKGSLPHSRQVGQTGKTVRPVIYLALGISGAVQHLAGMDGSDFVIAVNTDKDAPIFSLAHLGIVGDANKIMPLLEQKIRDFKQDK